MLYLHIGALQGYAVSGDGWFDMRVDENCLLTDFANRVVKGVDNSDIISSHLIESPILGAIPPSSLSGGTKTLLTIMFEDCVNFDLAAMGDNCFPYLKEICDSKDVYMCTDSFRDLFGVGGFEMVYVVNDNSTVDSSLELIEKVVRFGQ